MARVKAARDGIVVSHRHREIETILRARGRIPSGIKNELEQEWLIERGIINHKLKFSTISVRRKDSFFFLSILTSLFFMIKL
jgi:hypothetical protein